MRTFMLVCLAISFASVLSAPTELEVEPIDMVVRVSDEPIEETARSKRSGSGDFFGAIKNKLTSGVQQKLSLISHASSGGNSYGGHGGGYYEEAPASYDHKSFDFLGLKKSIFNTLLQAVKAIKGGVIAIKGQLIKGTGQIVSTKGKIIATKGEAISNYGRHLVEHAFVAKPEVHQSNPIKQHFAQHLGGLSAIPAGFAHQSVGYSAGHASPAVEHYAVAAGPSHSAPAESYGAPLQPHYTSAYLPQNYGAVEDGHQETVHPNEMHAGLVILKQIPSKSIDLNKQHSGTITINNGQHSTDDSHESPKQTHDSSLKSGSGSYLKSFFKSSSHISSFQKPSKSPSIFSIWNSVKDTDIGPSGPNSHYDDKFAYPPEATDHTKHEEKPEEYSYDGPSTNSKPSEQYGKPYQSDHSEYSNSASQNHKPEEQYGSPYQPSHSEYSNSKPDEQYGSPYQTDNSEYSNSAPSNSKPGEQYGSPYQSEHSEYSGSHKETNENSHSSHGSTTFSITPSISVFQGYLTDDESIFHNSNPSGPEPRPLEFYKPRQETQNVDPLGHPNSLPTSHAQDSYIGPPPSPEFKPIPQSLQQQMDSYGHPIAPQKLSAGYSPITYNGPFAHDFDPRTKRLRRNNGLNVRQSVIYNQKAYPALRIRS